MSFKIVFSKISATILILTSNIIFSINCIQINIKIIYEIPVIVNIKIEI